jgi:hypothetical protein
MGGYDIIKNNTIEEKIKELGCNLPDQIAIIPKNFNNAQSKTDLSYGLLEIGALKILSEKGINGSLEVEGERFKTSIQFSEIQILQILIDHVDPIITGMIANLATTLFVKQFKKVRVKIIKKPDEIIYDGPGENLKDLPENFWDLE